MENPADLTVEPVESPIRVFLLDDHEIVRRGLIDLLDAEQDIVVVGEAGTARDAEVRIPATHPHVAVLDSRLPDGSGIDVCRGIRSSMPQTQCLILTSYDGRLASLTDREREVLGLITEGLTNRQIGDRLFLAEKTVKNYVSGLLAKLGMERRTQAAVFGSITMQSQVSTEKGLWALGRSREPQHTEADPEGEM